MSLGWSVLRSSVSAPCPKCGYHLDFQFVDARCGLVIICPACKSQVKLVDEDASVWKGGEDLDRTESDLRRTIDKLNRDLKRLGL